MSGERILRHHPGRRAEARPALFVLLVGVAGVAGFLYLRRLFARAAAADRSARRRDFEAGEVDETRFDIVDAIEVAEAEDEGRHFYLRLADGRVLFLSGQYLYEPVAAKRFPAARLTLIRAPITGTVLAMRPEGEFSRRARRGRPSASGSTRAGVCQRTARSWIRISTGSGSARESTTGDGVRRRSAADARRAELDASSGLAL